MSTESATNIPSQTLTSPFMVEVLLRNHVLHTLHDVCNDLQPLQFPSGTASNNWSTIVAEASTLKTTAGQFAVNYLNFACTQPTQMEAQLTTMVGQLDTWITQLQSGSEPANLNSGLQNMLNTLNDNSFNMLDAYRGYNGEWNTAIGKASEIYTALPAITSNYTQLLEQFKTALIQFYQQVQQAYGNINYFHRAIHIVELFISPEAALLKGFMAKIGDGVVKLDSLNNVQQTLEDIGRHLAAMEPAEATIVKAAAKLHGAIYLATNIGKVPLGRPLMGMLHDCKETVIQQLNTTIQAEQTPLAVMELTALRTGLQEYLLYTSHTASTINFNDALITIGMTEAEINAAIASGHSKSIIQHWEDIISHTPDR
jgi:hypothetical protein